MLSGLFCTWALKRNFDRETEVYMDVAARWREISLNLLRIVTGLMFACHGAQKLFGVLGFPHRVPLESIFGLAGILEFFGGLAIALGLFTRAVAFVLCGEMAIAYWSFHVRTGLVHRGPLGIVPIVNQGELAVLYCFIFLLLVSYGAGGFSLDRRLRHRG
jgi:putative oxidoreductase